jgi:hypothetical protein
MLMAAVTANARIEWEQKEVTLPVHPTQASAEAIFGFINAGDEPVAFSGIESDCGCLAAKPLKPSYAPGEKGQLVVVLNLRNRYGKLRKKIVVRTNDGEKKQLMVSADVARPFTLKSPLVNWRKGDTSPEKRITLRNPNAIPIKLLSIESSNEQFPAELETVREGFEYEAVVRRMPGIDEARSVIRIRTEPPPGLRESKVIRLYVSVK